MSNECTDQELEEVVQLMGYKVNDRSVLKKLKKEIETYFNEEYTSTSDENDDIANQSLFASLSIDPQYEYHGSKTPYAKSNESSYNFSDYISSPIISKKRSRSRSTEKYEEIEDSADFENLDKEKQEVTEAINEAHKSIIQIYKTCENVESFSKMLEQSNFQSQGSVSSNESILENEAENSISISPSQSTPPSSPKVIVVDPSIRKRFSLKPGRAPFKFDPVTRYHLYQEEWKRHPAPGEMRRLSLKWKVREYLLRHDIPNLDFGKEKALHPKDWSPKPYMD